MKIFNKINLVIFTLLYLNLYSQSSVDADLIKNTFETQSDDFSSLGTARYAAMAGSMGALGGDVSAMNTNPAGGAIFLNNTLSGSILINSTKNYSNFENNTFSNNQNSQFSLTNLGGVLVFELNDKKWKNFNLGINYQSQNLNSEVLLAENEKITFREDFIDDAGNETFNNNYYYFGGYDFIREGSKSKFGINLSANYNNKFYFGTNLNFHNSSINVTERLIQREDENRQYSYLLNSIDTPYSKSTNGFSISIGAIAKINQMLRLGLAYQSPIWYNSIIEEYNYTNDIEINLPNNNNSINLSLYDGLRTTLPSKMTTSAALVIGKNIALNADYTYNIVSDFSIKNSNNLVNKEDNLFIKNFMKSYSDIRLGGEGRIDKWRFRLGYKYQESPVKENIVLNLDENTEAVISKNYLLGNSNLFSTGFGYNFGEISLDLAFQRQRQEYFTSFGGEYYETADKPFRGNMYYGDISKFDTYLTEVKTSFNNFILTLGWNF